MATVTEAWKTLDDAQIVSKLTPASRFPEGQSSIGSRAPSNGAYLTVCLRNKLEIV